MAIRLRKRNTLSSMHDVDLNPPPDDGDIIEWDEDLGKWVPVPGHQLAEANPTGLVDGGEINLRAPPNNGSFGPITFSDESATFQWQCIRDDRGDGRPDDGWQNAVANLSDARVVTVGATTTLYIDTSEPQDAGQISCLATVTEDDITTNVRTQVGRINFVALANPVEIIGGVGVIVDSYTVPDERPVYEAVEWRTLYADITAAPAIAGSIVYLTMANNGGAGELKQYDQAPTQETRRDEIPLGILIHNGDNWGDVSSPTVINNAAHTLEDYLNSVSGPTFIIDGGSVSEATGFTLDQAAGTVWEMNRNWHRDKKQPHRERLAETVGIQWRYVSRDFASVSALTGSVDPTQWDNAGTVEPVPSPGKNCTIQQLYQDPDNNYWVLWGQEVFRSYIEAAASIVPTTEVPSLLGASVLLGFIVSESNQTGWNPEKARFIHPQQSGGGGGGGVPITEYTGLVDTPENYIGAARAVQSVNDTETGLQHQYHMRAVPYVLGNTYYPQEVIFAELWQMIANKITTDDAVPQPIGGPTYGLPDAPVFSGYTNESVVYSGHFYTFRQPGYFKGLRVWVNELSESTNYRFIIIRNPNGENPRTTVIEEPVLNLNEWTVLAATNNLVLAGEELLVVIDALNSGDDVTWAYNWERDTNSNNEGGFPPPGMWNTNSGNSLLRINWTDAEAIPVSHQLELQVVPGTLFEISEVGDPARFTHFSTTGAYIEDLANEYTRYPVIIADDGGGGARVGEPCQIRAVQPIAQPTSFVGIDGYWNDATFPSWATVVSFLEFDGVPQPVAGDEAYGIDLLFQPIQKSDDWDVFGYMGT